MRAVRADRARADVTPLDTQTATPAWQAVEEYLIDNDDLPRSLGAVRDDLAGPDAAVVVPDDERPIAVQEHFAAPALVQHDVARRGGLGAAHVDDCQDTFGTP